MKIQTTKLFDENYRALPQDIKQRTNKQFALLLANPRHPSLRLKRMVEHPGIWEGSVTRKYRFTFQIADDTYILRRIGEHERTLRKS